MRALLALSCLVVLAPASLAAQWRDSIVAGARVRVERHKGLRLSVAGALMRYDSALVVVDPDGRGEMLAVALGPDVTVDVSEGRYGTRLGGFGRGAAIGFGVGAGVTLVATMATMVVEARSGSNDAFLPAWVGVAAVGTLGTVVTTVVGGAMGATSGTRDRWKRVWP